MQYQRNVQIEIEVIVISNIALIMSCCLCSFEFDFLKSVKAKA